MASVISLGVYKPSALPFLVAELILPSDPSEKTYNWESLNEHDADNGDDDEELITTRSCVVWSQGGVIQRVLRFEVEEEPVQRAFFTQFPSQAPTSAKDSKSTIHNSHVGHSERINGNLKVPKQRASQQHTPDINGTSTTGTSPQRPTTHKFRLQGKKSSTRSLVVVLKTKAHIFFLSETRHIVHLPFEVESAFPSVHGVYLQRKVTQKPRAALTPLSPSVPHNSFALSQNSQLHDVIGNLSTGERLDAAIAPLFNNILSQSSDEKDNELPSLFCLTDPLAEISNVVSRQTLNTKSSFRQSGKRRPQFSNLPSGEKLLYISAQDELTQHTSYSVKNEPSLILAVTEQDEGGTWNIWTVTYVRKESLEANNKVSNPVASGATSRRRSSFTPGMGTGNTTPKAGAASIGRESFGGAGSRRHASNDLALDDVSNSDYNNLLDPVLADPTVPARSSRRVSGLISRADLSFNNERVIFSEIPGSHVGKKGIRKHASFGPHGARLSAGPDVGNHSTKWQPLHGVRTSLDSVSLYDDELGDRFDALDEIHGFTDTADKGLREAVQGLKHEVVFTKIYGMPGDTRRSRLSRNHDDSAYRIITLEAPRPSLGDSSGRSTVTLYVFDRAARELLALQIRIKYLVNPKTVPDKPDLSSFRLAARVSGMTRRSGVLDICKIGTNNCARVLILSSGPEGENELTLDAPWSHPRRISLPKRMFLHNALQIASGMDVRTRRQGGFKRVLSEGPQALSSLNRSSSSETISATDSAGVQHRLRIQLLPHNPLVQSVIRVAESVLQASEVDSEPILRGWWDAMSLLKTLPEEDPDVEWTSIIVVLFSMGVAFIADKKPEANARQKKRKGGLLRSSSGANTNLESWEAMISQEASSSNPTPQWMQSPAWEWTTKEQVHHRTSTFKTSRSSSSSLPTSDPAVPVSKNSSYLLHCISLARDFLNTPAGQSANGDRGYLPTASSRDPEFQRHALASILVSLHLLREEMKLDVLAAESLHRLTPVLAQIGNWLGWEKWGCKESSYYLLESTDMDGWSFEDTAITGLRPPLQPFPPPSILHFIEQTSLKIKPQPIITLCDIASLPAIDRDDSSSEKLSAGLLLDLTPRSVAITQLLSSYSQDSIDDRVMRMASWGLSLSILESLPESVALSFRAAISSCQTQPSSELNESILKMIGRDDIAALEGGKRILKSQGRSAVIPSFEAARDVHGICHSTLEVDPVGPYDGSAELDRFSITRLLFKEDQRFAEAAKLLHPLLYPTARCIAEPEWSDTDLLEAQQELVKIVALRTLSVSPGRGLLFYDARSPLLTEKFPIHGFTLSCVMKPADTTITADRNTFTEEKAAWAFFHAGVEAGLSISKDAKGIDTSWILFNKPRELTTRHAGFLLALGLNGHLKSIAKWVAFKYLTPKHTMTSIGLLLGLSASYLGTMDTLITRLLSVHVTRMLPPGAAELNLSPLTQTSGIMGIGLLYCNTQHRRMSEIMLSEVENSDEDEGANPMDNLRDEGYRLAAGFALGLINLARGKDLQGLHDMHIVERLLVLAVGSKRVEIVHILDKATAAAIVALALVFMKSEDEPLARKVDVPDTVHQFEYVRPDMFLLRTVARHLIMWSRIEATSRWIKKQLPFVFENKSTMKAIVTLTSEDLPFYNIIAGLCLSIGLRFAGSGALNVRNLLCHYLDQYMRICRLATLNHDGQLARITVRNCQDAIALAVSCVMAGTGDIHVFRRLRSLHGRTDADTPYGSHLADHMAIGVLFLGGGTHTFGTSNIAIASLLCAFYPLFPNAVLDNTSHLQAFRHFWVLAAERRCLIPRDVDTHRPVSISILVTLRTGTEIAMTAPCLLPELSTIAKIQTTDLEYWAVTLDLEKDPTHLAAFNRHQSVYVRKRAAYESHASVFSATMHALNDSQIFNPVSKQMFRWIFTLPTFSNFDRAEQALVLPAESGTLVYKGTRGTVLDDRLVLEKACLASGKSERLWNLRILFALAEACTRRGEEMRWLGREAVESLRASLALRRGEGKKR
ncbi:Anaphase-promoting complex subunit 1 [Puttea exsequens]|nr:Anaphase-promoting complex subunit 1 [Puttea exsequens]